MKKFAIVEKTEAYRTIVYEAKNKEEARRKWADNEDFESCSEFEVNYEAVQIHEIRKM